MTVTKPQKADLQGIWDKLRALKGAFNSLMFVSHVLSPTYDPPRCVWQMLVPLRDLRCTGTCSRIAAGA